MTEKAKRRKVRVTYDSLADLAELRRSDNPKGHDIAAIKESVGAVGYIEPVVVNDSDGRILSGHGRVETLIALRERGEPAPEGVSVSRAGEWLVPVLHGVELSEQDAKRYVVAANQTTILGAWDDVALAASLADLAETEAGLVGTGFVDDDLAALRASLEPLAGQTDPDDAPDPTPNPYVKRGELYALGEHRVLCGDATSVEDVERLLAGEKIELVATDPPYGVDIQESDLEQARVRGRRKDGKGMLNDDLGGEDMVAMLESAFLLARDASAPGACWYVFAPSGVD